MLAKALPQLFFTVLSFCPTFVFSAIGLQGYETKDRAVQFEQRKAFQRLIYVSQLVFGDQKSAFLLPWRRLFNVSDAQASVVTTHLCLMTIRGRITHQTNDI